MMRPSFRQLLRNLRKLEEGTVVLGAHGFLRPAPQPPFRSGETTRCIECGASQWLVGRATAECAVCGAPAILASPITHTHFTSHRKG